MKLAKKLTCLLLALLMVFSLAMTAFAEENAGDDDDDPAPTVLTISGGEGREFEVYQLMTASIAGANYSYTVVDEYVDILLAAAELTKVESASANQKAILDYISKMSDNGTEIAAFADKVYRAILADEDLQPMEIEFTGNTVVLPQGYYLVADITDFNGDESIANSLVMMGTMGETDLTINLKAEVPTMVKKVDDENDSILGESHAGNEDGQNWEDTADYDIGDRVPYRIAMEMPNDLSNYEYYALLLTDVLSPGLTFAEDSFKMFIDGQEYDIAEKNAATTAHEFAYVIETNTNDEGKEYQTVYVFPNSGYKTVAGVIKEANEVNGGDAKAVGIENNQTVVFRYKCILNENAVIGNPGNPNHALLEFSNDPYGDSFGETPEDYCIVFTYTININKVDAERKPLAGAEFELYKFVAVGADEESTDVSHGMHGNWEKIDHVTVSEDQTQFGFKGLDDGFYKLVEKNPPKGYNKIEDICFHISAKHKSEVAGEDESALTELNYTTDVSGSISFTMETTGGSFTAEVINKSGTILPSTGGMGTTLFYVAGGIMVLAAIILLVTKKRMSAEK